MKIQFIKYFKLLILVHLSVSLFAQEGQGPADELNVKVIPPSPNAASLGEYGDVGVGMYTGSQNLSVPVYTLKGREINIPISLSYQSGGVRVNQASSWVGLSWALNAGGAISRTVNGFPDEHALGYLNFQEYIKYDLDQYNADDRSFVEDVMDSFKDADPDVFTFNFPGFSGKFVLSEDTSGTIHAHTIPYSDVKIIPHQTGLVDWEVITPDGTHYFFGEDHSSRETTTVNSAAGFGGSDVGAKNYTSTWYLTRIVSANNTEEINFTYQNFKQIDLPTSETHTYKTKLLADLFNPDCIQNSVGYSESPTTIQVETVKLSEISTPLGRVEFEMTATNPNSDYVPNLRTIKVFDKVNAAPLHEYKFEYDETVQHRFFLEKFYEFNLASGERINEYKFNYDKSESLPPLNSYARDHWGFYNGKAANQTLIPGFNACDVNADIYDFSSLPKADRDTDIKYLQIGMLTSVEYPTGGVTSFEYEPHTYSGLFIDNRLYNDIEYEDTVEVELIYNNANVQLPASSEGTFSINKKQCVEIPYSIFFNLDVANIPEGDGLGTSESDTYIALYNNEDPQNPVELFRFEAGQIGDMEGASFGENGKYNIMLDPGDYKVKAHINMTGDEEIYIQSIVANVDAIYSVFPDELLKNNYAGGLRIKKVSSYDGINHANDKVKEYIYNYNDETDRSSGKLLSFPVYHYDSKTAKVVEAMAPGVLCLSTTCVNLMMTSSSVLNGAIGQPNHVVYDEVTVVEGDGNHGKTVNEFTFFQGYSFAKVPFVPPGKNVGYKQGHLTMATVYDNDGNILKTTENIYDFDQDVKKTSVVGLKAKWLKQNACRPDNFELNQFTIYFYEYTSAWYKLDTTHVNVYDENGIANTSTTSYHYRPDLADANLIKQITTGNNGKVHITEFKYPLDFAGETMADQLIADNRISPVLEKLVSVKKGNETSLLGKTKTEYDVDGSMIIPRYIFLAPDGGAYEKRLTYHDYDEQGHILEYSKEKGIKNAYIWGYDNTLPVAEVQNASEAAIYYQGFEEEGTANQSTNFFTGAKSLNSNTYTISKTLNGTNLKMSYWYYDDQDSEWKFSGELDFNQTINTTGSLIDEVRVYPSGAQMTTYNYKPLVGITSVCDANNVVSYYEYDHFGRLILIRDGEGNILKKYEYAYHQKQ